ncbi:ATP-binding protein [Bacillus cytotoxicus]
MSYIRFLARLIEAETLSKTDRSMNRKISLAKFPRISTLEEFDFAFQPSINDTYVRELANLGFLEKKKQPLLYLTLYGLSLIAMGYPPQKADLQRIE